MNLHHLAVFHAVARTGSLSRASDAMHVTQPAPAALADTESADGAIRALLVPAATGIVLTHADLGRAVLALEAGLVQNRRAFILRHLMDQDGPAAFD